MLTGPNYMQTFCVHSMIMEEIVWLEKERDYGTLCMLKHKNVEIILHISLDALGKAAVEKCHFTNTANESARVSRGHNKPVSSLLNKTIRGAIMALRALFPIRDI